MKISKSSSLKLLKAILWIYIILCVVIAGLNYGYASKATPAVASFITWFWHFYENWIKTVFIIICSFLTLRIIGASRRTDRRKRNLIGFILSAVVVHIAGPLILGNKELYFFTMPLPWTTTPLKLLYDSSSFYQSRSLIWGAAGITAALIFYICFSAVVIIGTLLFGRRWQCSTLCLFNGFASEVFAPAIPLIGKDKTVTPKMMNVFSILRWVFLGLGVFFTMWWALFLSGVSMPGNIQIIGKVEEYIYLIGELFMAMFFWVAFMGRSYCYYCPLGTVLALLSKLARQEITTNNTKCVQCNLCNVSCSMSIDIKGMALSGKAVKDIRCVGCEHCVDACPTETLSYSTWFIDKIFTLNRKIKPDLCIEKSLENSEENSQPPAIIQ